ncbi:hypothetical protein ABTY53_32955 [Streptomyces noursei]|uniref:hypothetical protein n=1 Tax=Streptomyces noursei TaxID=1971 RepID=UPI00333072DE
MHSQLSSPGRPATTPRPFPARVVHHCQAVVVEVGQKEQGQGPASGDWLISSSGIS